MTRLENLGEGFVTSPRLDGIAENNKLLTRFDLWTERSNFCSVFQFSTALILKAYTPCHRLYLVRALCICTLDDEFKASLMRVAILLRITTLLFVSFHNYEDDAHIQLPVTVLRDPREHHGRALHVKHTPLES